MPAQVAEYTLDEVFGEGAVSHAHISQFWRPRPWAAQRR
jgi:hypothetical protein